MIEKMKKREERGRRIRGQALVEFAMVLTILTMIVFGVIEWGRLWMTANALTSAAREGVRVAAVTAPDQNQVRNAVQRVMSAANLSGYTVTTSGPDGNNEVRVTVQMDYSVLTNSIVPGLNGTIRITRSSIMRWEG
jgi:Flp pilus assembly protein TadG